MRECCCSTDFWCRLHEGDPPPPPTSAPSKPRELDVLDEVGEAVQRFASWLFRRRG